MNYSYQYYTFKANKREFGLWIAIIRLLVEIILKPRWIVGADDEDLGLSIRGIQFYYYKWSDPMIRFRSEFRVMEKREFGESIHPKKGDENA